MAFDTPRQLKLTSTGDLDTSLPNLQILEGTAAIAQAVITALQLFRGEWFANLDAGVPYFQRVLVKNPDANVLTSVFRNVLLGVLGVTSVPALALSFDAAARTLNVSLQCMTDFGLLAPMNVMLLPGANA